MKLRRVANVELKWLKIRTFICLKIPLGIFKFSIGGKLFSVLWSFVLG